MAVASRVNPPLVPIHSTPVGLSQIDQTRREQCVVVAGRMRRGGHGQPGREAHEADRARPESVG